MRRSQQLIRLGNVKTREFKGEDFYYLNLWLGQRDRPPIKMDELPKAGWTVIDDDERPVGMVFLRMVEGNLALIDSLINDPSQSSHRRHQINDRLFLQCIKIAKEFSFNGLLGMSLDDGTLKRAYNHGFIASPQTFAVWTNKELSNVIRK
jgi:hypothetical protein